MRMREPPVRTQRTRRADRDRIYLYLEADVAQRVRDYAEWRHITPSGAAREILGFGLDVLDRRERDLVPAR